MMTEKARKRVMAIEFTDRQKDAINAPTADILVSAAAGSGKTAVLTERIIKTLLDGESTVGIKDMLVVTFTKAAASELKTKIANAVANAYAENPSNRFLRKQLMDVENAQISTIHSFCADLIKEFSQKLSLPLSMRIGDSAEVKLLYKNAMDSVIESRYENDRQMFNTFVENFVSLRDGVLCDTLMSFYETLLSYPEGIEYIKESANKLMLVANNGFEGSAYAKIIASELQNIAKYCQNQAEQIFDFIADDEKFSLQKPVIESDIAFFKAIEREAPSGVYALSRLVKGYSFKSLAKVSKSEKTEEYERAIAKRNKYKGIIKEFNVKYFSQDDESIKESAEKSAEFCTQLYITLSQYEKEITSEKLKRGILDYNDLERYAHRLLREKGEISESAKIIASRYKQIYIDEYQDISPLQDEIFTAIGNSNIFMVGDIKQSIYGFRGSAPDLFASYRDKYPDYDKGNSQKKLRIFLTDNFRCDKNVIDFSNMVFDSLFNHDMATVKYLPEDALSFKKKESSNDKVEIAVVECCDTEDKKEKEARYVASRVAEYMRSGIKGKDIAVMLRSAKGRIEYYKRAFEEYGIKYVTDAKTNLFEIPAVMLAISALSVIDNVWDSISLAAVMKSPIFGFDVSELALLGMESKAPLYSSVKAYAESHDNGLAEKTRHFLKKLADWKEAAKESSSDELLRYLYSDSSLYAILKAHAEDKKALSDSLDALYMIAADFESNGFRGNSAFVRHLARLRNEKMSAESELTSSDDENKVSLITIHHSKGLEYEICFLSGMSGKMNNSDSKQELICDRELGVCLKLRDSQGYIKYDTPMRKASAIAVTRRAIEEEMRVLYVALTRAKRKLILTAATDDYEKLIRESSENIGKGRCYTAYRMSMQSIKWVLSACMGDPCYEIYKVNSFSKTRYVKSRENANESQVSREDDNSKLPQSRMEMALSFDYSAAHAPSMPSKIAVSALYPAFLDEDSDPMNRTFKEKPDFVSGRSKPSGAERGSATHLFMQFCNFENTVKNGVESEISRLTESRFITPESADLIYKDKLEAFFKSELYKQMSDSHELYREYRFNVLLDAENFTEDKSGKYSQSKVLVQGVIDCFFKDFDGEYVIVDYKTDKAYGENPEKRIVEEYKNQLTYYKKAIEIITSKKVKKALIYSFDLEKVLPIEF